MPASESAESRSPEPRKPSRSHGGSHGGTPPSPTATPDLGNPNGHAGGTPSEHAGHAASNRNGHVASPRGGHGAHPPPMGEIEVETLTIDDLAQVFHLGEKLFTSERFTHLYRTWDEFEVVGLFHEEPELCIGAYWYPPEAEEDDEPPPAPPPGGWPFREGQLVGFLLGSKIVKRGSSWRYGYLVWFGVEPEAQRMGVGEELFEEYKDRIIARGMRIMIADTPKSNGRALKFFDKHGFERAEEYVYLSLNLDDDLKKHRERSKRRQLKAAEEKLRGHRTLTSNGSAAHAAARGKAEARGGG